MLAPLRRRNFALFWIAGFISLTGDQLLIVALPFYVYTVSNSTLVTGAVFIAGVLPSLVLGSVAGVYVDRWDRKWTLVVANLLLAAVLLPLFAVQSGRDSWIVMAVIFISATMSQFSMPASNALLPTIVSAADLTPANALNAAGRNIALLAGPPLGGVALISLGLAGVALVDLVTFLIAAALTCITYLRGKHPHLYQRVLAHFGDIAITSVVAAELYYGAERSSDPAANRGLVDTFLAPFPLLVFDKAAAVAYGSIRADLARRGQLIGPNDFLIAAIALSATVTVVTHNTREFSRVHGLLVEDWQI